MAVRSTDQITLTDLTDGVSVVLSSEAYAFPGTTNAAIAGNTTTKIQAIRGGEYIAASVNVASITKPVGVTVTSDGHATAPTLTIAVNTSVTQAGEVVIPVVVDGLTVEKRFSFSIAFKGTTGSTGSQGPQGNPGVDATVVGLKNEAHAIVTNPAGAASGATTIQVDFFGYVGSSRAAVTAAVGSLPAGMTVGTNTAGTTGADGVLTLAVANGATLGGADSGTVAITLTCNGIPRVVLFSWSKAKQGSTGATGAPGATGATGAPGADAITLEVTSSQGLVFKNQQVATILTARVFKGGTEVTGGALTALGTIRWYKDGSATAEGTGTTLTITAGDVTDRATYEARLED